MPPLCSGLARRPLTALAPVRIRSGVQHREAPVSASWPGPLAFPDGRPPSGVYQRARSGTPPDGGTVPPPSRPEDAMSARPSPAALTRAGLLLAAGAAPVSAIAVHVAGWMPMARSAPYVVG